MGILGKAPLDQPSRSILKLLTKKLQILLLSVRQLKHWSLAVFLSKPDNDSNLTKLKELSFVNQPRSRRKRKRSLKRKRPKRKQRKRQRKRQRKKPRRRLRKSPPKKRPPRKSPPKKRPRKRNLKRKRP